MYVEVKWGRPGSKVTHLVSLSLFTIHTGGGQSSGGGAEEAMEGHYSTRARTLTRKFSQKTGSWVQNVVVLHSTGFLPLC